MNILHYLPSFRLTRGGPVRAVLDLADGFSRRGHRVTLLTCERGDAPAHWTGEHPDLPRWSRSAAKVSPTGPSPPSIAR